MKKITLSISLVCIISGSYAQACPQIEGLKPIFLRFAYNGNPETSIPVIPGYWNRIYKLDELTGQLVGVTCAFPCCDYFSYCVCFMTGTYFRRVTDACDPTPCGGDLPMPGMPITDNNSSGSSWSQGTTWLANQVPDVASSASVVLTKSTQIDVDLAFSNDHWLVLSNGNSSILPGKTVTCNSVIQVYPAAQLENLGTLKGAGKIFGSLMNSGTLSPGNSPGNFTIAGNYTANNTAVHEIEITSTNLFDTISVVNDVSLSSGNAILNGALNVSLLNGFVPSMGDTFRIVSFTSSTGSFTSTSLPSLPAGLYWAIHYNPTNIALKVEAGTLPLHFTKVNAYDKNNGVEIEWSTENEMDVKIFEIERSTNGSQFNRIGSIGSNRTLATYKWFDATSPKINSYYRIKAIDEDGRFIYSKVQFIKFGDSRMIILFPNPVKRGGILRLNLQNIAAAKIEIINTGGQVVYSKSARQAGSISIPVSALFAAGQYIIRVISENNVVTQKIQIQ